MTRWCSTCAAARAPTSARWPRTSARRWAAARTWRRCAAPPAARCRVADAVTLEQLAALTEPERDALLLPADALLADWPRVQLPDDEAGRFLTGLRRRVGLADAAAVRVYGARPSAFLGSAHIAGGELIADRLLSARRSGGTESLESLP